MVACRTTMVMPTMIPSDEAIRAAADASGFANEDEPPDAMLLRAVGKMLEAAYAIDGIRGSGVAARIEALTDDDVYRLNGTVWRGRPAESLAEAKRRLSQAEAELRAVSAGGGTEDTT